MQSLALHAVCIALGFWVVAVRIGDRSAWLLLMLLLSLASIGAGPSERMLARDQMIQPLFAGFSGRSGISAREWTGPCAPGTTSGRLATLW